MSDMADKAKLISSFRALWEIKGSKPNTREAEKSGISDRQVRKHFGGWTALQDLAVPAAYVLPQDGTIIVGRYKSLARSEKRKNVIQAHEIEQYFQELGAALLKQELKPVRLNKKDIKKHLKSLQSPTSTERELISILSDTHYGLNVFPEEVNGRNSFSWKEACRRSAFFAKEISEYKLHHRDRTKKLHFLVLGDILNGQIHGIGGLDNDLMTIQMCGAYHILFHMISYLLNHFDTIEFTGITGNHERFLHRDKGGRPTSQKWDNFINPIYYTLSAQFKGRVKFNIPRGHQAFVDTIGGRLCCVHGDTNFSAIGNPGTSINMKSLSHQVESFSNAEVKAGKPAIKALLAGHVHQELQARTMNGIDVVVNSCLSGLDGFANSLTINSSLPSQTIIEATKDYAIGDVRRVRFTEEIDNNKSLDLIIPTYKGEIVF